MAKTNLIRWSGLSSILGGGLYAAGAVLHPAGEGIEAVSNARWVPSHVVYWAAILLIQLGLVGLYARQHERAGWLGLSGFTLAFVGTALVGGILLYAATIMPLIAAQAPAIFGQTSAMPTYMVAVFVLGFGLGWVLFGMATVRAGVLPRWPGMLLIAGVLLFVVSETAAFEVGLAHTLVTVGDLAFGLGLMWLGTALLTEHTAQQVPQRRREVQL